MFPTAHPDIMVQLAAARVDELRAVAERHRQPARNGRARR